MMITTPSRTAAAPCSCGDRSCCDTGPLERPRFFPRQVVTATELTLEHDYQRNRARRHNRMLHGWGVVCGAEVCPTIDEKRQLVPWKVTIQPGFVLGPCGDEILIDCERDVDLRTTGLTCMAGMPPGEVSDPWCSDVRIERAGEACIAIRYQEFTARPVRVHPVGCGCGADDCEYSRWRDGYEIQLLPECPDRGRDRGGPIREQQAAVVAGADRPIIPGAETPGIVKPANRGLVDWQAEFRAQNLTVDVRHGVFQCPPCPDDDWVVLACVEWSSTGVVTVCGCDCRRYLVSLAPYAVCHERPASRQIVDERPERHIYAADPDTMPESLPVPMPAPAPHVVAGGPDEIVRAADEDAPAVVRAPSRGRPGPAPTPRPKAPAEGRPSTGGRARASGSATPGSSNRGATRSGGTGTGRSTGGGSTGSRGGATRRGTAGGRGATGGGGTARRQPRRNNG